MACPVSKPLLGYSKTLRSFISFSFCFSALGLFPSLSTLGVYLEKPSQGKKVWWFLKKVYSRCNEFITGRKLSAQGDVRRIWVHILSWTAYLWDLRLQYKICFSLEALVFSSKRADTIRTTQSTILTNITITILPRPWAQVGAMSREGENSRKNQGKRNQQLLKACLQVLLLLYVRTPAPIGHVSSWWGAGRVGWEQRPCIAEGANVSMVTAHQILMRAHLVFSGCSTIWHFIYFIKEKKHYLDPPSPHPPPPCQLRRQTQAHIPAHLLCLIHGHWSDISHCHGDWKQFQKPFIQTKGQNSHSCFKEVPRREVPDK